MKAIEEQINEGFKMTELGTLPEEWEELSLDDKKIITFQNGLWKGKKPPFVKVNVLRNTNFKNDGTLSFTDVAELEVELSQFKKRALEKGDIILERSGGGPKQPVGRVVLFNLNYNNYSFSNFTTVIRVLYQDVCLPKHLQLFLLYLYQSGYTEQIQSRTTGIRNLNFTEYKKIKVPLPPLPEQQRIAAVLSAVQEAKEKTEDVIKATRELKKSMMKHLFTYGPVPLDEAENVPLKETEIGLIPEHWEVVKLGALYNSKVIKIQNGFPCGNWNEDCIGVPHIRPFNISEEGKVIFNNLKYIQTNKNIEQYILRDKDIIFNNTNSEELVGKTAFWNNEGKYVLSNHMTIIRILHDNDVISQKYLASYLHKKWFDGLYLGLCRRHVNQASISLARLKEIQVPLPTIPEQQKIAQILSALDEKIEAEENKRKALEGLFKSLLSNLMTGKIRTKNLEV